MRTQWQVKFERTFFQKEIPTRFQYQRLPGYSTSAAWDICLNPGSAEPGTSIRYQAFEIQSQQDSCSTVLRKLVDLDL